MAALKYTFRSGIRKVTVKADSLGQAQDKARVELDRRIEKSGGCPPVGYDLELIEKKINWAKPKKVKS